MSAIQLRPPKFIAPQVPILSAEPPEAHGWIHQIKHDGFRTLLRIDRSDIRAFTRGILLGTDYDHEGEPIPSLGKQMDGGLIFAGTAFLMLSGDARDELQDRIDRLPSVKAPANVPKVCQPEWVKPEILVRVRHLKGGDTLRHASVQGLANMKPA